MTPLDVHKTQARKISMSAGRKKRKSTASAGFVKSQKKTLEELRALRRSIEDAHRLRGIEWLVYTSFLIQGWDALRPFDMTVREHFIEVLIWLGTL